MTDTPTTSAEEYWEDFYRERDAGAWSGRPNELLVREVGALAPGTALDLGCGEGGDALWLAGRGWRVTAADVSATALRRAAARAADAGLAGLIEWQRHDLAESFPAGAYDLVSAQFLHSPVAPAGERAAILDRAAAAVAPGGVLLIAGHAGWPTWHGDRAGAEPPFEYHFPTNAEVVDALALEPGRWEVETDDAVTREITGPEGEPGTRTDNVLRLRRAR